MTTMSSDVDSPSSPYRHDPPSPSSSTTFDDDNRSIVSASSSEDEDGVFFGAHDAKELHHLAKLSEGISSSPSPSSTSSPSTSSARSTPRIRKRDSREFLRRKTLGLSLGPNTSLAKSIDGMERNKKWSGGFYEQGARSRQVEVDSDEEWSTPIFRRSHHAMSPAGTPFGREAEHCDLTLDFDKFRLTDLPSPASASCTPYSQTKNNLKSPLINFGGSLQPDEDLNFAQDEDAGVDDDSDSLEGDSDKENSGVYDENIQAEVPSVGQSERNVLVTIGMDLPQEEDGAYDLPVELDMGGLRIDDLADPLDDVASATESSFQISLGDDSASEASTREHAASLDKDDLQDEVPVEDDDESQAIDGDAISQSGTGAHTAISDAVDMLSTPNQEAREQLADEEAQRLDVLNEREEQDIEPAVSLVPQISADQSAPFPSPERETIVSCDSGAQQDVLEDHDETSSDPSDNAVPNENVTISPMTTPLPQEFEPDVSVVAGSPRPASPLDPLDSPIPLTRAGPVIIPVVPPHLAFSIRAEDGSPCRSLPPTQPSEIVLDESPATLEGESSSFGATRFSTPPSAPHATRPVPSTEGRVVPMTPSVLNVSTLVGPAAIKPKTLLSSINGPKGMTASVDRTKSLAKSVSSNKKAAGRALAIRGQLESALGSRFGPPQRSASGSLGPSAAAPSRGMAKLASSVTKPGLAKSSSSQITQKVPSRLTKAEPPRLNASTSSFSSVSEKAKSEKPIVKVPISMPRTLKQSTAAPARLPLVSRKAPPAVPSRTSSLTTKTVPRPAIPVAAPPVRIAASAIAARPSTLPVAAVNPLKRPLSTSPTSTSSSSSARAVVSIAPIGRIGLGQPSRIVSVKGESVLLPAPIFSVGLPGPALSSGFKSPARTRNVGTPRKLGTPARNATPLRGGVLAKFGTPGRNGKALTPVKVRAPPTPTRSSSLPTPLALAPQVTTSNTDPAASTQRSDSASPSEEGGDKQRGSSEDHEDVSMIIPEASSSQGSSTTPNSSPPPSFEGKTLRNRTTPPPSPNAEKESTVRAERPKRSIKPPQQPSKPKPTRTASAPALSSVPGMSEKELRLATQRNTSKNEVYHCAIDRQIIRINAPRPPSPTSKIRTTVDRDEEEKKAGREQRAQRRSRGSDAGSIEIFPVVERVERIRGPGDEEDYKTPVRPNKKAKIRHEKNVKWDKELMVIRDDGCQPPKARDAMVQPGKSCLRDEAQVELDRYGNIVEAKRPKETLKRQKILVTARFYEGEEPVPASESEPVGTTSGKGKKKQ